MLLAQKPRTGGTGYEGLKLPPPGVASELPRLNPEEEISRCVRQLGDDDYQSRESAQKRLSELAGDHVSLVLPALATAKKDPDTEIASRASRAEERITSVPCAIYRNRPADWPNPHSTRVDIDGNRVSEFTLIIGPSLVKSDGNLPDRRKIKVQANLVRVEGPPLNGEVLQASADVTKIKLAPDGESFLIHCVVRSNRRVDVAGVNVELPMQPKHGTEDAPLH